VQSLARAYTSDVALAVSLMAAVQVLGLLLVVYVIAQIG
jgi:hypothetical protein